MAEDARQRAKWSFSGSRASASIADMSDNVLISGLIGAGSLLWPVIQGCLLYASWLCVKALRRPAAWCLLVGHGLMLLISLLRLALMVPALAGSPESHMTMIAVQSGLSLVAGGLTAYGLVGVGMALMRQSEE